jgi:hypothetical protein
MMGKIDATSTVTVQADNTATANDRLVVRYHGELDGKLLLDASGDNGTSPDAASWSQSDWTLAGQRRQRDPRRHRRRGRLSARQRCEATQPRPIP